MPHAGGRPTKYREEFCDKVDKYLTTCSPEQMEIPTREGFAILIGTSPEKISIWCRKHKKFRQACKKIDILQKKQLMNLGLFGGKEVNATMAIFLLKVNHDMIESEKRILVGDKDRPIRIDTKASLEKVYGQGS